MRILVPKIIEINAQLIFNRTTYVVTLQYARTLHTISRYLYKYKYLMYNIK